jgi:hypothetical protein
MSQVFTDDVTLIELIESKPCLWDKTRGYVFKERVKASFRISYSQHWMYPVFSFAFFFFFLFFFIFFFLFSAKIKFHKQVALPISMHKHLSCAALSDWSHIYHRLKLKYILSVLATGSGNAGTYEKLHDQSRIRFRQKAGVCASGLTVTANYETPAAVTLAAS